MLICWRGNGLMIAGIGFFPAALAMKLGAVNVALAYVASAVVIYLLRDVIGRESSFLVLPTLAWPPVLLVIAGIVHMSAPSGGGARSQGELAGFIRQLETSFPRDMGDHVRVDRASHTEDTLYYHAHALRHVEAQEVGQSEVGHEIINHYCKDLEPIWRAKINLQVALIIPPLLINDRVSTQTLNFAADSCEKFTKR